MCTEELLALPDRVHWVDERHILEFCLLRVGKKPVVRVPVRSDTERGALQSLAGALSATLVPSRSKTVLEFTNELGEEFVRWTEASDPQPGEIVVYLSLDPSLATAAEAAEHEEDNDALAALLGYPRCCAEAYSEVGVDGRWIARLLRSNEGDEARWECNKLAYALCGASLFPDYFPCSLTCEATRRLTHDAFDALIAQGLRVMAERHRREMQRAVLQMDGRLYSVPEDLQEAPLAALVESRGAWFSIPIDGDLDYRSQRVLQFT